MKYYQILALLGLVFFSCTKKKDVEPDYAIIKGSVPQTFTDTTLLVYLGDQHLKTIPITKNHEFNDTVPLRISGKYDFGNFESATPLYLFPGAILEMDIKEKDLQKEITFKGEDAVATKYYRSKIPIDNTYYDVSDDLYSEELNEDEREKWYGRLYQNIESWQENLLANLKTYPKLTQDFINSEERHITYSVLSEANNNAMGSAGLKLPVFYEKAKDDIKNLAVNEEDYKASEDYRRLLYIKHMNKAFNLQKKDTLKTLLELNLKELGKISNQYVRENLIARNLRFSISSENSIEVSKQIYDTYISLISDQELAEGVKAVYSEKIALSKGQPSPKFKDYENYNGSSTSLDDFKGKYLYIDVWATWCKPCIAEIPALKELEKAYHDKKIEFVSISVDNKKDYDKWKAFVQDENLTGHQLYATKSFDSPFMKDFGINAIPRFILIDPNGNIVDKQAPRPSGDDIVAVLNTLKDI